MFQISPMLRIKITQVRNSANKHMIGKEVNGMAAHHEGESGVIFYVDGNKRFLSSDYYEVVPSCDHDWLDTGLVNTWCRHCGQQAYYDFGKIIIDISKPPTI